MSDLGRKLSMNNGLNIAGFARGLVTWNKIVLRKTRLKSCFSLIDFSSFPGLVPFPYLVFLFLPIPFFEVRIELHFNRTSLRLAWRFPFG